MRIFVLITLCAIGFWAGAQEKGNRYAVKSGHVTYELTGSTKGTKTVYWDDYGDKSYEEIKAISVVKLFGMTQKEEIHSINIMVGDRFWNANLIDNTGQKGKLDYQDEMQELAGEMTEAEAKQLEKQIMDALGGEKLGKETILNRQCDVIQIMGSKAWVYKGVLLKSQAKVMGIEVNELATLFKENIAVPTSKFEPLANISYQDISAMQQRLF